ncbi:MAG: hypothetical protein ACE37H_09890 [Phycisphaeraceae bacterium]
MIKNRWMFAIGIGLTASGSAYAVAETNGAWISGLIGVILIAYSISTAQTRDKTTDSTNPD